MSYLYKKIIIYNFVYFDDTLSHTVSVNICDRKFILRGTARNCVRAREPPGLHVLPANRGYGRFDRENSHAVFFDQRSKTENRQASGNDGRTDDVVALSTMARHALRHLG